jgi:hypothetical protein
MVEILNQLDTEIILENIDACGVIEMRFHLFKTLFFYQLDFIFIKLLFNKHK